MTTLNLNRGEAVALPFVIRDDLGTLDGKRVTWVLAHTTGSPKVLTKASTQTGQSSAEVLIASNDGSQIVGSVSLTVADFDALPDETYAASLWIDSGVGDDACVTPGGADLVYLVPNVERA